MVYIWVQTDWFETYSIAEYVGDQRAFVESKFQAWERVFGIVLSLKLNFKFERW